MDLMRRGHLVDRFAATAQAPSATFALNFARKPSASSRDRLVFKRRTLS